MMYDKAAVSTKPAEAAAMREAAPSSVSVCLSPSLLESLLASLSEEEVGLAPEETGEVPDATALEEEAIAEELAAPEEAAGGVVVSLPPW